MRGVPDLPGDDAATLLSRIRALSPAFPSPWPEGVWHALARAYGTPGRHYHALAHVLEVAERYAEVAAGPGWADPHQVWLAVLFHDAVYSVGAADNEAKSAVMCVALARRWLGVDATRAAALIHLTAAHGRIDTAVSEGAGSEGAGSEGAGLDADACHFLDCDMAILGADPDRFAEYERAVAAEYTALYPLPLYLAGRRAFLEGLLASDRIFLSDWFHTRLEARARANLEGVTAGREGGDLGD